MDLSCEARYYRGDRVPSPNSITNPAGVQDRLLDALVIRKATNKHAERMMGLLIRGRAGQKNAEWSYHSACVQDDYLQLRYATEDLEQACGKGLVKFRVRLYLTRFKLDLICLRGFNHCCKMIDEVMSEGGKDGPPPRD